MVSKGPELLFISCNTQCKQARHLTVQHKAYILQLQMYEKLPQPKNETPDPIKFHLLTFLVTAGSRAQWVLPQSGKSSPPQKKRVMNAFFFHKIAQNIYLGIPCILYNKDKSTN